MRKNIHELLPDKKMKEHAPIIRASAVSFPYADCEDSDMTGWVPHCPGWSEFSLGYRYRSLSCFSHTGT